MKDSSTTRARLSPILMNASASFAVVVGIQDVFLKSQHRRMLYRFKTFSFRLVYARNEATNGLHWIWGGEKAFTLFLLMVAPSKSFSASIKRLEHRRHWPLGWDYFFSVKIDWEASKGCFAAVASKHGFINWSKMHPFSILHICLHSKYFLPGVGEHEPLMYNRTDVITAWTLKSPKRVQFELLVKTFTKLRVSKITEWL